MATSVAIGLKVLTMMKFPDVQYYKTDFTGISSDNTVTREYHERIANDRDLVFILKQGHFYRNSLKMFKPDGSKLNEGEHYEFYGLSRSITAYVKNQPVGLFIKLLDPKISQWYATYQVVGNFNIINQDITDEILTAINDDRPVYIGDIKGLPKWFPPELHQHDLRYEIHSFKDLIDQVVRINEVYEVLPDRERVSIDHFYATISFYIDDFKNRLMEATKQHNGEDTTPYVNDHGLTAKQMQLEKVDNFDTATYIQLLEGIRNDLHITADLAKQIVNQYGKESDQLFHKGVLPIIRYGNNNFIPPSIDGSFEGMGGNNFNTAMGQEPDGTWLILTPRVDGRVASLYFMRNTTIDADVKNWDFTAYRYIHPRAVADGVELKAIVNGSNQKFLIVGDGSKWYWSYGYGTLDPAKHQLNPLPTWTRDGNTPLIDQTYTSIITAAAQDKIYVLTACNGSRAINDPEWVNVAYQLNGWDGSGPVEPTNTTVVGLLIWELDVKTNVWRKCRFNYSYCGDNQPINSDLYVPYVHVVRKGYPRADGLNPATTWSLTQTRYAFSHGINFWSERWFNFPASKYDPVKKRLALKYYTTGYGTDNRNANFEGGGSAFGISLENPKVSSDTVTYDVVKGLGLQSMVSVSTEVAGSGFGDTPNNDGLGNGWAGSKSYAMITDGVIYSYGTLGYGTFPAEIFKRDLRKLGEWENYDLFFKSKFKTASGAKNSSFSYNEVNPVGLSIGMHSEFYMLPDINNPSQYGCVGVIQYPGIPTRLVYRRMDGMDSNKSKKPPTSTMTVFGSPAENYPLSNVVKEVNSDFYYTYNTVVLQPTSARKNAYLKYIFGHSTYASGKGSINNDSANHIYRRDASFSYGDKMEVSYGKTYDLENIVKTTIGNSLKAYIATLPDDFTVENFVALYAVTPACLESGEGVYVFTTAGMDEKGGLYTCAIAFRITGEADRGDGIFKVTAIQLLGNWVRAKNTTTRVDFIDRYRKAGESFGIQRGVTTTSPRNIIMQQRDGSTVIVIFNCWMITVTGNSHRPGVVFRVTNDGLTDIAEYTNYWTAGEYRYFPHPYYGIGMRAQPVGAASVGKPIVDDSDNNYENIRKKTTQNKFFLGMNNYIEGAFTVYFKSSENVTVGGVEYTLPSGYIDIFDIDANPYNKTFYCYLGYDGKGVSYKITPTALPDTYSQALLAIIKTNSDGIYEIRPQNVFTMNGFRIGTERHGSTIPAATGTIVSAGQTSGWADNDNDLS